MNNSSNVWTEISRSHSASNKRSAPGSIRPEYLIYIANVVTVHMETAVRERPVAVDVSMADEEEPGPAS